MTRRPASAPSITAAHYLAALTAMAKTGKDLADACVELAHLRAYSGHARASGILTDASERDEIDAGCLVALLHRHRDHYARIIAQYHAKQRAGASKLARAEFGAAVFGQV